MGILYVHYHEKGLILENKNKKWTPIIFLFQKCTYSSIVRVALDKTATTEAIKAALSNFELVCVTGIKWSHMDIANMI